MILIADIGATKSDWRLIRADKIEQFKTSGFNPNDHSEDAVFDLFPKELSNETVHPDKIYLYGAGLVHDQRKESIKSSIQERYPGVLVEVDSDLLGAARSLLGDQPGIACILGTGSSACFYDGSKVTKRIPALGHLLGDEGSGFALGKEILQKYVRGFLPEPVRSAFEAKYGILTEVDVLSNTYKIGGKFYVASFAQFVIAHQSDPMIYSLIVDQFNHFFDTYFADQQDIGQSGICFTGSIAHFLSNVLHKVARDRNLRLDLISQHPIAGLALYHQQHG